MDEPFTHLRPTPFQVNIMIYVVYIHGYPHPINSLYLVAPFWANVDIEEGGVSYQVYSTGSPLLDIVNTIISDEENINFTGHWMVVAEWNAVSAFNSSRNKVRAITKQRKN